MNAVRPLRDTKPAGALAPVANYLAELHQRISSVTAGKPADYIPELGKADPNLFGIAIATVDGQVYAVGDTEIPFTIQSVSKPFMYGYALQHHGREAVLKHVGVEPTGEAFNSIVLDEVANRPFNPARSVSASIPRRSTSKATACAASASARKSPKSSNCMPSTTAPMSAA
jgi:glutaminase